MSRPSIRGTPSQSGYASPQYPPSYSGHSVSARSSYPQFLSLPETLKLQVSWALKGLLDAFRWDIVFTTVTGDPEIRGNVLKSLLLNALSLTSIYVFDLLLQPMVRDQQKWLHRNVGWFYQVLWLLPVVGASLYLNTTWCAVVAKRTYALQHGSRHAPPPSTYSGMLTALAESAYRGVMVFTSVFVSFVLSYVPLVGPSVGFVFFCWIDAYYCFEFIWIARGYTLAQRIRHVEERWAYYLAFGFPAAALCMLGSSLANAASFALVLPSFIIMAMRANPVPSHPYNPLPPSPTSPPDAPIRYPSPFIPIRIPVFAPVIWINDAIVSVLSVGIGKGKGDRRTTIQKVRRPRGMSESTVASVEEGTFDERIEMKTLGSPTPSSPRVGKGSRRSGAALDRRKAD
ncbi:hypothetical protein BD410DRAFT_740801 [Rickenella mellea]|uniref:EI24-domain-containing protein n=1 Tax=Rickenella mellea TaxID=50990 RepID=A0A4Y7QLA2_9AGAM|nr:hypothetical protein BD410DRAFT_740801 [Rickenella mellea]